MKVLVTFGTRPEAIKLAPVVRELRRRGDELGIEPVVCVTGQHRSLLDQVVERFGLRPDHDLKVMRDDQTPVDVAAGVMTGLQPVLAHERPDWVLVQGDTTTVAATALAAFYSGIRLGHVEAGLRTYDRWRPFPEEVNRRIAGATADLHFAPTAVAEANLLREGVAAEQVVVTGNPVIDALQWACQVLDADPLPRAVAVPDGADIVLVTAHRRESFGAPFEDICGAVADLARALEGRVAVVFVLHPNPHVARPARDLLHGVPGVTLVPALDYLELVDLMRRSRLVLTDSGGLQEEGPSLGVPVLVLREVTERPEAVAAGAVRVVGTERGAIAREALALLRDPERHAAMAHAVNPYGDGQAARRIVAALAGEEVEPFQPAEAGHVAP